MSSSLHSAYSNENVITEYGSWGFDFQRYQQEIILMNQLAFKINSAIVPRYPDLVSYFAAIWVFYDEIGPIIKEKHPPTAEKMEDELKKIKELKGHIEQNKNFGKDFVCKDSLEMRDRLNDLKHNLMTSKIKVGLGVPLKRKLEGVDKFRKAAESQ
jgi:hypothetical protein